MMLACASKDRWRTREFAEKVLHDVQAQGRPDPPTRVYKCPFCSGWHLSSYSPAQRRQRIEERTRIDGERQMFGGQFTNGPRMIGAR
jgi:hypothetical protein